MLPFIKLKDWADASNRPHDDPDFMEYFCHWHNHQDIWTKPLLFLNKNHFTDHFKTYSEGKITLHVAETENVLSALHLLSDNKESLKNPFILRDAVDLTRTALGRFLNFIYIKAFGECDMDKIKVLKDACIKALDVTEKLLSVNPDFSMYETLKHLKETAPCNPDFEAVLKRNIYNEYCSQPAYELMPLFKKEAEIVFDWILSGKPDTDFKEKYDAILKGFEETPLAPVPTNYDLSDIIKDSAFIIETIICLV